MNKTRAFAVGCLLADTKCASAKVLARLFCFQPSKLTFAVFHFQFEFLHFQHKNYTFSHCFLRFAFASLCFVPFFDFIYSFSCYKRIPSSIIWLSLKCSAIWLCFLSSVIFVLLQDSFIFC